MIVKQLAALRQIALDAAAEKPTSSTGGWTPPKFPNEDNDNPSPDTPSVDNPPIEEKPANTHFALTTTLDNTRVIKSIGNLMDEVINHLMQIDGADIELKLLVEATLPNGTPVPTVRTVTENCKTLHVDHFGFDN